MGDREAIKGLYTIKKKKKRGSKKKKEINYNKRTLKENVIHLVLFTMCTFLIFFVSLLMPY